MDVVAAGNLGARFLVLVMKFDRFALLLRGKLGTRPSSPAPLRTFPVFAWVGALSAETGLDLGRTKPPIAILYVTEVHEHLVPEPLAALRTRFEWPELNTYDVAGPTGRHGVLLGTRRWHAWFAAKCGG
jgi:hypothetical protein